MCQSDMLIIIRHIPFFYKPCIPLLCSKRLFLIVLPDFHTAYFTADGFGKFVYKLYDARIFVRCGHFLYVVLQLLNQFFPCTVLIFFGQYNGSFHHLSPNFIGNSGNGAFYNRGMRHQGAFHFERADTVTAALDNVVGASHEPEITVLVFPGNVAGVVDVIVPCFMGAVGVSIIFFEQTERFAFVGADYNLSLFTGFYRRPS